MENGEKRGYLEEEFKVFFLTDTVGREFENHYHGFAKIIIFLKGKVNYTIEGKSYELVPFDIVLVNQNEIHRLEVREGASYERMVFYISPEFLTKYKREAYDLQYCFCKAKKEHTHVLRISSLNKSKLYQTAMNLKNSLAEEEYAGELYQKLLFLEFMIHLNRAAIGNTIEYIRTDLCNRKIADVLEYINENLTENLSIDNLSKQFYISKYHMMHLFRNETGYTIGNYVNQKRLQMARELIMQGLPITQACYECGFRDNSTFSRAYKNLFGESPREMLKMRERRI